MAWVVRWFARRDLIFFLFWHSSLLQLGPENLQNTLEMIRRNFRVKREADDERRIVLRVGGAGGDVVTSEH